jgi:hypothetical protein
VVAVCPVPPFCRRTLAGFAAGVHLFRGHRARRGVLLSEPVPAGPVAGGFVVALGLAEGLLFAELVQGVQGGFAGLVTQAGDELG